MKVVQQLLTLFILFSGVLSAEPLTVITSEEPPLNFTSDQGVVTGFSTDVVREIQRRVGNREAITIYPWNRLLHLVGTRPNVVAFTMARTPEREHKFNWITVVNRNAWMLYAKTGSGMKVSSLEEAKKMESIGVVRGDVRESVLRELGFQNLDLNGSWKQVMKKLYYGRISLAFFAASGAMWTSQKIGVDINEFEILHTVKMAEAYIVMSKSTAPEIVKQWQQAAQQMKEDGTFAKIMQKWIVHLKKTEGFETHLHNGALNLWKAQ